MALHISPLITISETEVRANFAKDRAEFEECIMGMNALAPEVICNMRTPSGYKDADMDARFQGFLLARNNGRNVLKFGIVKGTPVTEPTEKALEIVRFTEFYWGDDVFPAPVRDKTYACAGYVLVTNNMWPERIDTKTGKVIYKESDNIAAEYIDVVYMAHTKLAEGRQEDVDMAVFTVCQYAQILRMANLPIKTIQELRNPDGEMVAILTRLRATHEDFLADQVRWTK